MSSFIIYDGNDKTRRGEEEKVGVLGEGDQLFEFGDTRVPVTVEGSTISIHLDKLPDPNDVMIMGYDNNWHPGSEFMRRGSPTVRRTPGTDTSIALLGQENGSNWRAIHFETEQ